MEKSKLKFKHLNTILMYVAILFLVLSVVMYFFPFVTHIDKFSNTITRFSGYDFTRVLSSNEQTSKMYALKSLLSTAKTSLPTQVIAYLGPTCCIFSDVMVVLTLLSRYNKKFNNMFVSGAFFAVWFVLALSVVTLVGSMAVTKGTVVVNNYHLGFGAIVGCVLAVIASIINIVKSLKE